MLEPLRIRDFALLWTGMTTSLVGDAMLTWWVKTGFKLPFWREEQTIPDWQVNLTNVLSYRPIRTITLCFGVLFHIGIWITLEYMDECHGNGHTSSAIQRLREDTRFVHVP